MLPSTRASHRRGSPVQAEGGSPRKRPGEHDPREPSPTFAFPFLALLSRVPTCVVSPPTCVVSPPTAVSPIQTLDRGRRRKPHIGPRS